MSRLLGPNNRCGMLARRRLSQLSNNILSAASCHGLPQEELKETVKDTVCHLQHRSVVGVTVTTHDHHCRGAATGSCLPLDLCRMQNHHLCIVNCNSGLCGGTTAGAGTFCLEMIRTSMHQHLACAHHAQQAPRITSETPTAARPSIARSVSLISRRMRSTDSLCLITTLAISSKPCVFA